MKPGYLAFGLAAAWPVDVCLFVFSNLGHLEILKSLLHHQEKMNYLTGSLNDKWVWFYSPLWNNGNLCIKPSGN